MAGPALTALKECVQFVSLGLAAIARFPDADIPTAHGGPIALQFDDDARTPAERKHDFVVWLQTRAFHDMVKGVRGSLEEALLYISIVAKPPIGNTVQEVEKALARVRKRIGRLNFPELFEEVNSGLTSPMTFEAEFSSLNKIRNCLEHRRGVVGDQDVDANGRLTLSMPRLRVFYVWEGEEIELKPGDVTKGSAAIMLGRGVFSKSFSCGDQVLFTTEEVYGAGWACYLFALDLLGKLPDIPSQSAQR